MPQSDSLTAVTQAIVDELRRPTNLVSLGIPDGDSKLIYYGDQQMIPKTPAVAVEPGGLTRVLSGEGASGRTDNTFTVYLMCYLAKISSNQVVRKESDELAELVVDILHKDVSLGGLVIHGYVTSQESGFAIRSGSLMRASRLTWQGLTKTLIT